MTTLLSKTRHQCKRLRQRLPSPFRRKNAVHKEVKAALAECTNMYQLLDFLFSTDFHRDEAFLKLFEKRIQEIDASYSSTSILHF